jgi:spore coat polysaccharide biosynthesis predicted glycosyltransferase SpsG
MISLVYFPDAAQMKQIMETSDMAVSAGGQTLYELARMGVPTIAVSIIDNQQYDIDGLLKAGFIEYAGSWEDEHLEDAIVRACYLLSGREERLKRSVIGRAIVDGLGASRIVDRVIEAYNHADL